MQQGFSVLQAISPLDGRYRKKIEDVSSYSSEEALIRYRVIAELTYLQFFLTTVIHEKLPVKAKKDLKNIIDSFDTTQAEEVKTIEKTVNHDVKAVEYYLRGKLTHLGLEKYCNYIHFALTSEDINSIAHALMLRDLRDKVTIPELESFIQILVKMAEESKSIPMLARTHGQPAVPTTVGKELIVFAVRLEKELKTLKSLPIEAKITGAVGNYNAHLASFPLVDWIGVLDEFITDLGLTPNHFTTQILPADASVKIFQSLELINTILIGFVQDMWRYISCGFFIQKLKEGEVGSSTMPQKVNPIDFENAEGNLGLANALFHFFEQKLAISRMQRDLSDSTVKRSIGSAVGYSVLAYRSTKAGLSKVSVNKEELEKDLSNHWEIVTEGIQTVLRSGGDPQAYEKVKAFCRGKHITKKDIEVFISSLSVPTSVKKQLSSLSPFSYIGLAEQLVDNAIKQYWRK